MSTTQTHKRLPITVLTGFLGAGKTTLLNHILKELSTQNKTDTLDVTHPSRVAVIENEFAAAFGIENEILDSHNVAEVEELYEFGFGCVCCSGSGELLRVLQEIAAREREGGKGLDWILLETTGLADPGPVISLIQNTLSIRESFYVDGVVTVVDAQNFLTRFTDANKLQNPDEPSYKNEPLAQILGADRIVINKTDTVSKEQITALESLIKTYSTSPITRTTFSTISLRFLFGVRTDSDSAITQSLGLTKISALPHDPNIQAIAASVSGPVEQQCVLDFVRSISSRVGSDLYRVKGYLFVVDNDHKIVVQGVGADVEAWPHRKWEDSQTRDSRITFIGKGLRLIQKDIVDGFNGCAVSGP